MMISDVFYFYSKNHQNRSSCRLLLAILIFVATFETTAYVLQQYNVVLPSIKTSVVKCLSRLQDINRSNNITHLLMSSLIKFKTEKVQFSNESNKFYGMLIHADGPLIERIGRFNKVLTNIRLELLAQRQTTTNNTNNYSNWNDEVLRAGNSMETIWGARDDYLEILASRHRHILTVALTWKNKTTDALSRQQTKWNSLTDLSNVLVQKYYQWTGDNQLCTWIETPGVIAMKYDSIYRRKCERNLTLAASRPVSLEPLFLYGKPINKPQYWPNDGESYPSHFYTDPPPFVFYLHIHQDAVVNGNGDVFSGRSALLMYLCRSGTSTALPSDAGRLPHYNEVLTLTQMWGTAVFHRMIEVVPRISVLIDFLNANPEVRIQAPGSSADRLNEVLRIFGIDDRRVVYGDVRANIVYQPRPTGCGFANVQESQVASKLYREYIHNTFHDQLRPRNRLVLIRRSGSRRFTEQNEIEVLMKSAATDFGLEFELFIDNPTPSFNDTMKIFNSAVMIVGPHGAGLSNMIFSEPGTFVVEGVCNIPHVNLCFQRLAHVLGHRWHGVTSRGGCEGVVNVSADSLNNAVRSLMRILTESRFNVFSVH